MSSSDDSSLGSLRITWRWARTYGACVHVRAMCEQTRMRMRKCVCMRARGTSSAVSGGKQISFSAGYCEHLRARVHVHRGPLQTCEAARAGAKHQLRSAPREVTLCMMSSSLPPLACRPRKAKAPGTPGDGWAIAAGRRRSQPTQSAELQPSCSRAAGPPEAAKAAEAASATCRTHVFQRHLNVDGRAPKAWGWGMG